MPLTTGAHGGGGLGEASLAVGHAAAGDGGGDGERVEATPEVAGKEVPPPAEGMPGIGVVGKGVAAPSELVPVKIGTEGEEEEELVEAVVVEEEEEKWLKLYSSMHSILTVGDGDFSFSLSLASRFGSGALIVATSLDASGVLLRKYNDAESNIMELKRLETTVLHGVDVKTMKFHTDLKNRRFDRIVINFPHAGFQGPKDQVKMINLHKELLKDFFCNARYLLMPYGEIHVRHKTGGPYNRWDLEQLASDSCLIMFEKEIFQIADYPGYNQKRGNGARCDQPFNLGPSCTFKFVMGDLNKRKKLSGNKACSTASLGMSNVHPPGNLETDSRPFHPLPLLQAWPWLHFTPPVNTVGMPIPPQPMFNFAAPLLNALPAPGIIPPQVSRIAFHNLLALLNQPYYQKRSVAGPPPLGGSLQRGCEAMMPGAAGLSYSSAFLEQCYRESVQRQEGLRAMMPGAAGLSYSSAFLEQCYKESVQRQEGLRAVESASAALSYSSAFLEQCYRESVQRQERLNRMITYGCQ